MAFIDLTFYADESGHNEEPNLHYVGMAGFVAPLKSWLSLENKWDSAMKDAGFSAPFHMKEFAHCKGQFSCWESKEAPHPPDPQFEPERRKLLGQLVQIIIEAEPIPIGAIVSIDAFDSLTENQRDAFKSPYHIAFQTSTRGALGEGLPIYPSDNIEKVATVYSHNQEFGTNNGDVENMWRAMKNIPMFGPFMQSYTSSTPEDMIPLQVADLFSYELCHEMETIIKAPQRDMRWALKTILQALIPKNGIMIRLFDRSELLRTLAESGYPDQTGVEELSPGQMNIAMNNITKWMYDRAGVTIPMRVLRF
jgi:hypothetical protein